MRRRIRRVPSEVKDACVDAYNRWRLSGFRSPCPTDLREFADVLERTVVPSDISDHLPTLFLEALAADAKLIVELGTRGGESTLALARAAAITGARVVSVDIDDCSHVSKYPNWTFVCADDLQFGVEFPDWCERQGLPHKIDVLFIDTTHEYEQTRSEIRTWLPHLAPEGRLLFHDSNMGGAYRRRDGTIGMAGHNERGVIRALEDFLGCRLDETRPFEGIRREFVISHNPACNGMTVLRRSALLQQRQQEAQRS